MLALGTKLVTLSALGVVLGACTTFDPPPEPRVEGLDNGVMTTAPDAPLELTFSERFKGDTLRMKVVRAEFDGEGNLLDEGPNADPAAFGETVVLSYDGAAPDDSERTFGATFERGEQSLVVDPDSSFNVTVPYLALIEPGLEDFEGHQTLPRIKIPFTYQLAGGGPTLLPSGYYFFLMNVDYVATQIQAFCYLEINPDTGIWRAIFTNGNRLDALNARPGCPSCSGGDICALVPGPSCVKPSVKQTSLDQYVDFLPDPNKPNGYIFIADGFARDEPSGTAFGTPPFLLEITIGTGNLLISAENTTLAGEFQKDASDRWRAAGSLSVEVVKLNGSGSSGTKGQFEAMSLTQAEVDAVEAFGFPIPTDLGK